jgi:peptidoglycan/xylan/chitin deacetylase (PgdA/CDA1 family)
VLIQRPVKRRARGAGAILLYHRLTTDKHDQLDLNVTASDFESHMECLQREYPVMSARELTQRARRGDLTDPTVALTFDDGYVDALVISSTILNDFGFPATFFIVSGALTHPCEFWWDTLDRVLLGDHALPDTFRIQLRNARFDLATSTVRERHTAHGVLSNQLRLFERADRDRLIKELVRWSHNDRQVELPIQTMTGNQVLQLASKGGVEVGSHTENHLWLPSQPPDVQLAEVRDSKVVLERLLGRSVTTFAYPYGGCDPSSVKCVRQAGYQVAMTVDPGVVSETVDLCCVPRNEIRACDGKTFANRLRQIFETS